MFNLRARILVALLILAGGALGLAQPCERDVWHAFVADGQRYGYQHTTVAKLPDGNFRYVLEARLLVDVLGVQRQEHTERLECVVTPAYQPVSIAGELKQASGETRASGRVQDGKLLISSKTGDLERSITIDLSAGVIPEPCLDDWLHNQPAERASAAVRVIRPEGWSVQPVTLTRERRDAAGSTWHIELAEAGEHGTLTYDAAGVLRDAKLESPKVRLERCDSEQAKEISYRKLEGRDVLAFPLDKDISNPQRLTELTVKLTWQDIPFERFELEDRRQHIVEKSEQDGRYQVVLKIAAPPAVASRPAFPIDDPKLASCLAETQFIKPKDERIVAAAREVVAGKKTALEAVEALGAWVAGYIKGSLVAETLTGPEILERKTGKCAEYAILFASLARAVGIPTRIVLGDRLTSGQWIGHMWNEAYVGEWVSVDASANEVGSSLALLKFTHHDRVMGTQPLRWALTDSLDVSILDFKLRPSALADKYRTGIEGPVYTNVDFACRLTAADKDWTLEDKSKPGVVTIRFKVPGRDDVLIHFVAFPLPGGVPPQTIIEARLNLFRSYKDLEVLKNEACTVGEAVGHTLRFRRAAGEGEPGTMLTTEVVWARESSGYLLNVIAEEAAHEKYSPSFQKLLASFEPLKAE